MTTMPNQPDLLPCPFCGDMPKISQPGNNDKVWNIYCECGSAQVVSVVGELNAYTAWNTRTPSQQPTAPIESKESQYLSCWTLAEKENQELRAAIEKLEEDKEIVSQALSNSMDTNIQFKIWDGSDWVSCNDRKTLVSFLNPPTK